MCFFELYKLRENYIDSNFRLISRRYILLSIFFGCVRGMRFLEIFNWCLFLGIFGCNRIIFFFYYVGFISMYLILCFFFVL